MPKIFASGDYLVLETGEKAEGPDVGRAAYTLRGFVGLNVLYVSNSNKLIFGAGTRSQFSNEFKLNRDFLQRCFV